ncbi:DMT family transporter [Reinekea sp. G2M2-21]|uniref:DMT family transporter n=1 Tax=Reinekea sp. G2M2-21 TaxID=2788942 RepID=UPI0018AB179C|nr:DMT family transporter [Reinekea sp. G2M2-21]
MEILGYVAALGAASCWAVAGLLAVGPVRVLGPIPFNALRMLIVASLLTLWLLVTGQWSWPNTYALTTLILSGFIGIFLGDTLLFTSVKILGPRMAGLLFATNAPLSFLFGVFILRESVNAVNLLGVVAVILGVFIAIMARAKAGTHHWEQSAGHTGLGILAGFGAATCQSVGALIVVGLLRDDQDPVFATMVRVWVAVLFLFISLFFSRFSGGFGRYRLLTPRLMTILMFSGLMGMAIGMSLYLISISLAPLGIATILSATTPVIILPLLWIFTGERPSWRSTMAACIVVAGTSLIFVAR